MKYRSTVIPGKGRGKAINFPTLNLTIPRGFSADFGIYASWVWLGNKQYAGALHYGPVPVFDQSEPSLEIFVIDYEERMPVKHLRFELGAFLRPVRNFTSPTLLQRQIARDIIRVRKLLLKKLSP